MPFSYNAFLAAVMMFTRLPVSAKQVQTEDFRDCLLYLPAVGALIAACCALVFSLALVFVPQNAAVFFALFTGVMLTGALHEDGFADCCDGFFASRNAERIVQIMKDSSHGTFASLGLIFLLLGKFVFLAEMAIEAVIPALFLSHIAARLLPLWLVRSTAHCSVGKSKMSADLFVALKPLAWLTGAVFILACWLFSFVFAVWFSLLLAALLLWARWFILQRIQGYNGDCLGALEQLGEFTVLLLVLSYC